MKEVQAHPATTAGGDAADANALAAKAAGAVPGRGGRLVLVAAALMAAGAGGVAIYRGQQEPAKIAIAPPEPTASQVPSVDDVIAKLEARLKTSPEDAQGWRMLGWSYFQTRRYAEAATALKQSTKLDPEHAETFSFLGESLVLASDVEGKIPADARAAFERAFKLDPKDARARYFKAVSMDIAGQHKKAITAWFALLKDTPADAPYADDIRAVIRNVGKMRNIEVEKRLAAAALAANPSAAASATVGNSASVALAGPTGAQVNAAQGMPAQQQEAMIRGMVDGLEAKLISNPNNPDGWIMLMRSRMQLGEPGKAGKALKDGLAAMRGDAAAASRLREAAKSAGMAGS